MFRKFTGFLTLFVMVSMVVPEPISFAPTHAHAQEKPVKKRQSLLERFFNNTARKKRIAALKEKAAKSRAQRAVRKSKKKAAGKRKSIAVTTKKRTKKTLVAAAPVVEAVVKNDNSAKVLVIGDFMADALTEGLVDYYSQNPGIEFVSKAVGLSGMVRTDVFEWTENIAALIDEVNPVMVMIQVGMNDRQEIALADGKLPKLSEEWLKVYNARIDALAKAVSAKKVPFAWIGLTPVAKNSMSQDYLSFNEIYRNKTEFYGGVYVDIWRGFTDVEGRFVYKGPNIDGQIVTLRNKDGINMSKGGKAKMAFFAEKAVKRLTGYSLEPLFSSIASLPTLNVFAPTYDPVSSGETIVIALGSADVDGGNILEGGPEFNTVTDATKSSSFDLVARGSTGSQTGRVDSLWGTSNFNIKVNETPEPILANIRGMSFSSYLDEAIQSPEDLKALNEKAAADKAAALAGGGQAAPTTPIKAPVKRVTKPRVASKKKKVDPKKRPVFWWFKRKTTQN
ncbi:MAG: DUF459 domain-containing protein [Nitratireductor sp.]